MTLEIDFGNSTIDVSNRGYTDFLVIEFLEPAFELLKTADDSIFLVQTPLSKHIPR